MDGFLKQVGSWLPKRKSEGTNEENGRSPNLARMLQSANGFCPKPRTPAADRRAPPEASADHPEPMDAEAFRKWGKAMVDFVADYWTNLRDRKPLHNVEPGYIWSRVASEAPVEPDNWESIFADLEHVVLQGSTHWHHPHFFAYYPAANSYPAILGDILSDGLGCIGFTWNSSPACTELEMVVMDWLGKAINLPQHFLNSDSGPGAGMIQSTASDSTLVALLAARNRRLFAMRSKLRSSFSDSHDSAAISTLVAYCSDQAHSSVERSALLAGARMRKLQTNEEFSLTAAILEAAMQEDIEQGLVPFFVCATLGTTSSCAFDRLAEIGPLCQGLGVWVHVDAAYAGSSFVCPEYRPLMDGIQYADSFNFNPAKWLMVNMDCSAMWFKNAFEIEEAFLVDPLYLKHEYQGNVPDYKNLQVPLGRRFRSLKLWFVLRAMGIKGLQHHIRSEAVESMQLKLTYRQTFPTLPLSGPTSLTPEIFCTVPGHSLLAQKFQMCALAKEFESMVKADDRFEVIGAVKLGLVCFRAKGSNEFNEQLLTAINKDRRIHLVPAQLRETYILRFAICSSLTRSEDVAYGWKVITGIYESVMAGIRKSGHLQEG